MKKSYTGSRADIRHFVNGSMLRILDVGCSTGSIGRELKISNVNRYIFGIEGDKLLATEALKYLDQVAICDLNNFNHEILENEELFDCIIFADVLEHLIEPQRLLENIVEKWLAPGGTVVISLPNVCHFLTFCALFKNEWPVKDVGLFDQTHLRWFCWKNINNLVINSNLEIIQVNRNYRMLNDWKDKRNRFVRFLKWWPLKNYLTYQYVISAAKRM